MNCFICGPVKNGGLYLDKVLENIEKIGSIFDDYKILIYYDNSDDNTLEILEKYSKKNHKLEVYVNKNPTSIFRTYNIANARNYCLDYIKKNKDLYPYFIMMDLDNVNCKECNIENIKKYLNREDWDALSFNTVPKYYDIWALSIYPFCFSYNHFNNNTKFHKIIQNYISILLEKLPENGLLPCISAFNGFAIYRTNKFLDTYYDGTIRKDLICDENMKAHMLVTNSKLVYKQYVTVDARYEDCEHRAFHIMASQKSDAKIMISKDVIFT
jgi:hypothetical protein